MALLCQNPSCITVSLVFLHLFINHGLVLLSWSARIITLLRVSPYKFKNVSVPQVPQHEEEYEMDKVVEVPGATEILDTFGFYLQDLKCEEETYGDQA